MSRRTDKVEELLRDALSEILLRELKDPRIGFLTITGVKVTTDLRNAQVFYSVLGDETQRDDTAQALKRATGFVRSQLGRKAVFRFLPELDFRYDPTVDHSARVLELLEQVKLEPPVPEPAVEDETAAGAEAPRS